MSILCIYHNSCADGFGAALVVKQWAELTGQGIEFIAAQYGDKIPAKKIIMDKKIIIVDFSYPRKELLKINCWAEDLLVIDHHKTAQADLMGLDFCIFDMESSGAVLAHKYFFPELNVPPLLKYIQDRDLWQWKLKDSAAISSALKGLRKEFGLWLRYLYNVEPLIKKGKIILAYEKSIVDKIAESKLPLIELAGYKIPCVNSTVLASEIGNEISKGHPFAVIYFDTADKRIYQLRSAKDGIDVSKIARLFKGGGHYHAAGFSAELPRTIFSFSDDSEPLEIQSIHHCAEG